MMIETVVKGVAFAAAIALLPMSAQADVIQFDLTVSGIASTPSAGNTGVVQFQLDTAAPAIGTGPSGTDFGGAALLDLSFVVSDSGGTVLDTVGLDPAATAPITVRQLASNAADTFLGIGLNASSLTGLTGGTFFDINLSANAFLSFDTGAPDFVPDLLFDDQNVLLSNIKLGPPAIDRDNFSVAGPGTNGITSFVSGSSGQLGNFVLDSVSVTEVPASVVPVPAPVLLLLAALTAMVGLKRRRPATA